MFASAPASASHRDNRQSSSDMPFMDNVVRIVSVLASLFCFITGLIHLWISFENEDAGVRWSRNRGFVEEHNVGWQKDFELTPEAIVWHWQPLIIGWIALSQHMQYSRSMVGYNSFITMAVFYVFVAAFGCFGYAGNFGIIAGSLSLVSAAFAVLLAIFGGDREPQNILF